MASGRARKRPKSSDAHPTTSVSSHGDGKGDCGPGGKSALWPSGTDLSGRLSPVPSVPPQSLKIRLHASSCARAFGQRLRKPPNPATRRAPLYSTRTLRPQVAQGLPPQSLVKFSARVFTVVKRFAVWRCAAIPLNGGTQLTIRSLRCEVRHENNEPGSQSCSTPSTALHPHFLPVSLQSSGRHNLDLTLTIDRRLVAPLVDSRATDAERVGQFLYAAEMGDCLGGVHCRKGIACYQFGRQACCT